VLRDGELLLGAGLAIHVEVCLGDGGSGALQNLVVEERVEIQLKRVGGEVEAREDLALEVEHELFVVGGRRYGGQRTGEGDGQGSPSQLASGGNAIDPADSVLGVLAELLSRRAAVAGGLGEITKDATLSAGPARAFGGSLPLRSHYIVRDVWIGSRRCVMGEEERRDWYGGVEGEGKRRWSRAA